MTAVPLTEHIFSNGVVYRTRVRYRSCMLASRPADLPPSELDDDSLIERFRDLELADRRIEAEMAMTVAEIERRRVHHRDGHRTVRNFLRAEANWSGAQIVRRRRLGELFASIRAAADALHDGHIGIAQADELGRARANPRVGADLVDAAEILLDQCEQLPFDDARACIKRWETLADLDGSHRERMASEERRVAYVGELDGGLVVSATGGSPLDAAEITAIFDAFVEQEFRNDVAERTESGGPDAPTSMLPRTDAQRRFDALHTIFRAAAANPTNAPSRPITLDMIVDRWTFQDALARHGLAEPPDRNDVGSDPTGRRCETDSGVPLLPDDALRAALDGHVRRIVLDSDGAVVDVGRKRRLFTGTAREVAKLLARRCECPGCTVSARFAQIDHLIEHAHGGYTDLDNAGVLCQRDNRFKTRNGLRAVRRSDGQLNWYRRDGTEWTAIGRRHVADLDEIGTAIRRRLDALLDP
jgi:hypothetical protein